MMSLTVAGAGKTGGIAYSIGLKKGSGAAEANRFGLRNATTATDLLSVQVNHDTMAVTSGSSASIDIGVDGWYRLTLTAIGGMSDGDNRMIYAAFPGASEGVGENVLAWGALVRAL